MRPAPTTAHVRQAAERLGMHLDEDEAAIYRDCVTEQLGLFHDFLADRFEEGLLPISPDRAGGHRPDAVEDPRGAWAWKCSFGGTGDGLLAGRTVSFKDHISVAGIPQSFNVLALQHFVPDVDATVVSKVLAAGGTVIGKNVFDGFTDDYPKPINPRDADREPGGSSSGSAVAVAAREVDISIGGDQGGSIRIPAAYCGVMGLKPTFGLVSHFGVTFGFEQSLDHIGPIARTVTDLAHALDAIAGHDGLDPRQDRAVPDRYDSVRTLDQGVTGLRIGILEEGFDDPIEPAIRDGVLAAVEVLASRGAIISRVSVPMHRRQDAAYGSLAIEGSRAAFDVGPFGVWSRSHYPVAATSALTRALWDNADRLPPRVKANHIAAELSRHIFAGAVYAKAHNVRQAFVDDYDAALSQVDVLALPTVRAFAQQGSQPQGDRLERLASDLRRTHWMYRDVARNTKPFNYTGHPALAVPCGDESQPAMSLQLVGRHFSDALLLRTAAAFVGE